MLFMFSCDKFNDILRISRYARLTLENVGYKKERTWNLNIWSRDTCGVEGIPFNNMGSPLPQLKLMTTFLETDWIGLAFRGKRLSPGLKQFLAKSSGFAFLCLWQLSSFSSHFRDLNMWLGSFPNLFTAGLFRMWVTCLRMSLCDRHT